MAKKKKEPDAGPSQAYLLSFGDTMTTLLAFFIVLNSLAEEQTGANLYAGTGSFMSAVGAFGLGGMMPDELSRRAVSHSQSGPNYLSESPDDSEALPHGDGPDADHDLLRSLDREAEDYQRFINEMSRLSEIQREPDVVSESSFDFFEPLRHEKPYVPKQYGRAFAKMLPYLKRPEYRVEMIVWATTPAESAWKRAVMQTHELTAEFQRGARLNDEQKSRFMCFAATWLSSEVERPAVSIVVRRVRPTNP